MKAFNEAAYIVYYVRPFFLPRAWLHHGLLGRKLSRPSELLVKDMLNHPGSENHQWEGCKGLADLATRDSDGLSAVRRQGGIQVLQDRSLRELDHTFLAYVAAEMWSLGQMMH